MSAAEPACAGGRVLVRVFWLSVANGAAMIRGNAQAIADRGSNALF